MKLVCFAMLFLCFQTGNFGLLSYDDCHSLSFTSFKCWRAFYSVLTNDNYHFLLLIDFIEYIILGLLVVLLMDLNN